VEAGFGLDRFVEDWHETLQAVIRVPDGPADRL
jgi:hypothetical protein